MFSNTRPSTPRQAIPSWSTLFPSRSRAGVAASSSTPRQLLLLFEHLLSFTTFLVYLRANPFWLVRLSFHPRTTPHPFFLILSRRPSSFACSRSGGLSILFHICGSVSSISLYSFRFFIPLPPFFFFSFSWFEFHLCFTHPPRPPRPPSPPASRAFFSVEVRVCGKIQVSRRLSALLRFCRIYLLSRLVLRPTMSRPVSLLNFSQRSTPPRSFVPFVLLLLALRIFSASFLA